MFLEDILFYFCIRKFNHNEKNNFISSSFSNGNEYCFCTRKRQVKKEIKMTKIDNKQKVVELLKSIETGDSKLISYINPKKYI